jgi:xylulokinase
MHLGNVLYSIGIDAGTTSIKGILLTPEGEITASAGKEYKLDFGDDNTCEIDPEVYWLITCKVIQELIGKSGVNASQIAGIAFSSQGETLIVLDAEGNPLRKAIIWLDNRSVNEAKQIEEKFGNQRVMDVTGQPEIVPIWPATRILWLRSNEPIIFSRTHKYLLVEDYLLFRMTGTFHTEYSLVSSTLYFDINKKQWWKEMLDFLNISDEQLPHLNPSGKSIGNITPEAAMATGLTIQTQCITGAYDHPSGAIGAGNIYNGDVTLTIGASMAMCVSMDKPIFDLSMKLPCQCHAVNELYFLLPYGQTAGMVLKWFRDEFCHEETQQAKIENTDPYDLIVKQAEKIQPGADGLIMLPHLMGAGSPEFNPEARGVFAGIKMGMGKGHFIRAILESITCMIHRNIQIMRNKGISITDIHVLGGGSKSRLWMQMLADMTGLPAITLLNSDNAATGAALLAGVGTGIFKNLDDACHITVKEHTRFEPDPLHHEQYKTTYNKYLQLYESLEKFWQ